MKFDAVSRRMFLQGAKRATLAIPLLPSLMPKLAWGDEPQVPLRYVVVAADLGYCMHADWYPTNNRPANQLAAPGDGPVHTQSLKSFVSGPTASFSPIFGSLLNPYLSEINFLRGLDNVYQYGHSKASSLGNVAASVARVNNHPPNIPTIDHVINNNRAFNPNGHDVALMGYTRPSGVGDDYDNLSWARGVGGAGTRYVFQGSPQQMFNKLFPNPTIFTSPTAAMPDYRVDQLSAVLEDYRRTMRSGHISATDKATLEATADRFNDLQKSLGVVPMAGRCDPTGLSLPGTRTTLAEDQRTLQAFADVLFMGMACDVVRVGVLASFFDNARSAICRNEFGIPASGHYHESCTHNPYGTTGGRPNRERITTFNRWHVTGALVPLLQKMSGFVESNGKSMLYNSLVHYTQESSLVHHRYSIPTVLAGKAGGRLKTGHLIDYQDRSKAPGRGFQGHTVNPTSPAFTNQWPGLLYNRLFPTIFNLLGIEPAAYQAQLSPNGIGTQGGYGYIAPSASTSANAINNEYRMALSGSLLPLPSLDAV